MINELYRVVRKHNYEEWVIIRDVTSPTEKLLLFFMDDIIKVFLITFDKNVLLQEEYLLKLQSIYHHHQDYNDAIFEVINPNVPLSKDDSLENDNIINLEKEKIIKEVMNEYK